MRISLVLLLGLFLYGGTIAAQPGYLFIDSKPPGAAIEVDGFLIDTVSTPTILTLQAGTYEVTVSKGYFAPIVLEITIPAGEYVRKTVEFTDAGSVRKLSDDEVGEYGRFAQLAVITDLPGAEVWVDGLKVKLSTPLKLTALRPGVHNVGVAYDTLVYDTMMNLTPGDGNRLYVELAKLSETAEAQSASAARDSVSIHVTLDVPGCDYRIPDAPATSTVIRGVDPVLTIVGISSHMRLAGTDIAATRLEYDHHNELRRWRMPDSAVNRTYRIGAHDSVLVKVEARVSEGRKFRAEKELKPLMKVYPIHGQFNRGQDINIDIRIEPSGVIHFRYF